MEINSLCFWLVLEKSDKLEELLLAAIPMAKKPTLHPYSDRLAFQRILLLIATFLEYPGIGYLDPDSAERQGADALEEVRSRLREIARTCGIILGDRYPSIPTLRKDLETLREYRILDRRMYRWGYYLGTAAMNKAELKVALQALTSQAKYQADPQVRRIYETLCKRLRGFDGELKGELFYPVRQNLNRAINYTDPEEMMATGNNRKTLYHEIERVETAIAEGIAIEISRVKDFYHGDRIGPIHVWPLQLVYYNIAWYLIYEYCENGHLAIGRMNRFADSCNLLTSEGRGTEAQRQSLETAHTLLENGWGLFLGDEEAQKLELEGKLELTRVKVRFFDHAMAFIKEGELRHPAQKITSGKDSKTGQPYVDYTIQLPPRSLDEFSLWVFRYMDKAEVREPKQLREKHAEAAKALLSRYR